MNGTDVIVAVLAVAAGFACLAAAVRIASPAGRLGLLFVGLLAVLIGLGVRLPTWHQITDYLTTTPTEVNR